MMAKTAKPKVKEPRDNGESLVDTWREICHKQKSLMIAMIALAVFSVILLVFALTTLRPQSTVVIVGYGDVYGEIAKICGGYRRDSWLNMLAFPALAVLYGFVHNLIILRVYRKYGKDVAIVMAVATMLLIVGTFVIIFRLLGEW